VPRALDAKGATSLVLPLMGASSGKIQRNDARFEGQRALKECRLMNSTAGIALGIHDFRRAPPQPSRDWRGPMGPGDRGDVRGAGRQPRRRAAPTWPTASTPSQILQAFRKGLDGRKTLAGDLNGSCSAVLDPK
jgi:hypothetical protein